MRSSPGSAAPSIGLAMHARGPREGADREDARDGDADHDRDDQVDRHGHDRRHDVGDRIRPRGAQDRARGRRDAPCGPP